MAVMNQIYTLASTGDRHRNQAYLPGIEDTVMT